MIAAICSGVCGTGVVDGDCGCALGARGFLGAGGFIFLGGGSGTGISSGGGSVSTIGSSGISSIILGLFLLPGGRPRRLGAEADAGGSIIESSWVAVESSSAEARKAVSS